MIPGLHQRPLRSLEKNKILINFNGVVNGGRMGSNPYASLAHRTLCRKLRSFEVGPSYQYGHNHFHIPTLITGSPGSYLVRKYVLYLNQVIINQFGM